MQIHQQNIDKKIFYTKIIFAMQRISLIPFMVLPLILAVAFPSATGLISLVGIVCFVIEMFKAGAQEQMKMMVGDFIVSFMLVIAGFCLTTYGLQNNWHFVTSFPWVISMVLATADVLVGTVIKFFRLRRDFSVGG